MFVRLMQRIKFSEEPVVVNTDYIVTITPGAVGINACRIKLKDGQVLEISEGYQILGDKLDINSF